jgi:hypothetical protein
VSEQPTAPAGGGKRIFGLPRNVVIIGGVTFLAALGYILWKRSQAKAATVASNAASTTASTSSGSGTDVAGELSVIQTELEALLAGQGQPTGTTTTTTPPPPQGSPVAVAVPDGNGGWMTYTFPSQKALNDFYAAIGVQGGAYPNGLTASTIKGVLNSVGAQPGDVNNAPPPGPGTAAPPPVSVGGLPSYGPA